MKDITTDNKNSENIPIGNNSDMNELIANVNSSYEKIDEKIIYLLKTSSEDFLNLNGFFKNYYKEARTISELSNKLFETITQPRTERLIKDFRTHFESMFSTIDLSSKRLGSLSSILFQIDKNIQQAFTPFHNLRQNLSSVRLLMVNSNLPSTVAKDALPIKKITELQNSLEEIGALIDKFGETRDVFRKTTDDALAISEQIRLLYEELLQPATVKLSDVIDLCTSENQNIQKYSKVINTSYGEIITNLQYQDIIRQKIEHIQQSHTEVISELSEIKIDDNNESQKDIQRVLCKLRDITGIQSAQLLHANKQYQMAVEVILNKFFELSDSTHSMVELSKEVIVVTKPGDVSPLLNVIYSLKKTTTHFDELFAKVELVSQQCAETSAVIQNMNTVLTKFNQQYTDIEIQIGEFLDSTSTQNTPQAELLKSVSLFSDIKQFIVQSNTFIRQVKDLSEKLVLSGNFSDNKLSIPEFHKKIPELLPQLQIDNDETISLLKEIISRYAEIKDQINHAVKDIKYYNYFEKNIEEIIIEMSLVNSLFIGDEISSDFSIKEHLEKLKKKYTMNSEHLIHNQIAQNLEAGNNIDDGFFVEIDDKKDEEVNDDDLELF
jgi:hypothetical protein